MAKGSGGNQFVALLVLLGLVGGGGTWNYRRNAAADAAEYRPYRTYSVADLAVLRGAYEEEIESFRRRYTEAARRNVKVSGGRMLAEQIREFERIQRVSRTTRDLGSGVSEREAALTLIAEEEERRAAESDRLMFHLKRAVTFRKLETGA